MDVLQTMCQLRVDDRWFRAARVNYAYYVDVELVTLHILKETGKKKINKGSEKEHFCLLLCFLFSKFPERMNSIVPQELLNEA